MAQIKEALTTGAKASVSFLGGPDTRSLPHPTGESIGAENFFSAARACGLHIRRETPPDGRIYRVPTAGDKSGGKAGYYALYPDPLAGFYGDFRTGEKRTWSARNAKPLTRPERRALADKVVRAKADAAAAREAAWRRVAEGARERWGKAQPCLGGHLYLEAKRVKPYGLRAEGQSLLVPLRDAHGVLWSLQTIAPDGAKRFLVGGRVKGLFYAIGEPCARIVICEGCATGASLYAHLEPIAGPHLVACALNAGNLAPVAEALARRHPRAALIIAADNDAHTPGNPGVTYARKAAQAIGARVLVPPGPGDWNDYLSGAAHAPRTTERNTTP
jgi:putative DNA primase/helicase